MKLRWRLHTKLFVSYLAVIFIGAATLMLVMSMVTPVLFDRIMLSMMHGMMAPSEGMGSVMGQMMAGVAQTVDETIAQSFRETVTYALLVSAGVAVAAGVIASLFVSRRLVAPIGRLALASHRIAAGHYAERVETGPTDEVGELADSFNQMAASLEETERRRLALVGDVAHELRTPLATIEGYAEGLIDGVVEPSPETFALLHTEAGRLRRLVDDLQELSRAEARQLSLHLRPTAPSRLLEVVEERLGSQFTEKGVSLAVHPADGLPAVLADEGRALQVLTNLLGNALRYTPAGGRVEVTARRAADSVEFAIADTGIGIAPDHLPHVFERFYRADRSRSRAAGGSGIGLTVARHLVEAQGGHIHAESAGPGRGATFSFTLPIAS